MVILYYRNHVVRFLIETMCLLSDPYYFAQGFKPLASGELIANPTLFNVSELIAQTDRYAATGYIDPTSNMFNSGSSYLLALSTQWSIQVGRNNVYPTKVIR